MSKKATLIASFALISLFILGCKKNTNAEFKLDKYEYSAGDQLEISNFSKSDVWIILNPLGEAIDTIYDKNPNYILPINAVDGVYSLQLYDNEKAITNKVYQEKKFVVKTIRATLKVYGSGSFNTTYTLLVDGVKVGVANSEGNIQVSVPVGNRYLEAVISENSSGSLTAKMTYGIDTNAYFN